MRDKTLYSKCAGGNTSAIRAIGGKYLDGKSRVAPVWRLPPILDVEASFFPTPSSLISSLRQWLALPLHHWL